MAIAFGQQVYVGSLLQQQHPAPRVPSLARARLPDGLTRAEISEVISGVVASSADFLGAISLDEATTGDPARVRELARNLRLLAQIVDAGADALAGAGEG